MSFVVMPHASCGSVEFKHPQQIDELRRVVCGCGLKQHWIERVN